MEAAVATADSLMDSSHSAIFINDVRKVCAVPICSNMEQNLHNIHFFPFPADPERCLQWLLMCDRIDLIPEDLNIINANYFVCAAHFQQGCFVKNHKRLLKATSIPTLMLKPDEHSLSLSKPNNLTYSPSEEEIESDILNDPAFMESNDFDLEPCEDIINESAASSSSVIVLPSNHTKLFTQKKNYYICDLCNKKFTSKIRLEFHVKFHLDQKSGICIMCNKRFSNENLLYRHMWYLHGGGRDQQHKDFNNLTSIIKLPTAGGGKCSTCGKSFTCNSARLAHEERKHSVKRQCYQCQKCSEAFATEEQIQHHISIEHGENSITCKLIPISRLYKCEYCLKLFTKTSGLGDHRFIFHSNDAKFCCLYCGEYFSSHENLLLHVANGTEHLISHYKEDHPERPIARKFFCCRYCSRMFQNLNAMMEHQSRHNHELIVSAKDMIMQDVHQSNNFQMNATVLTLSHVCKYCSKKFSTEPMLTKHIRSHTGEKPYKCEICGKGFSQSSSLNTHSKVHSDERPYSCRFCSRAFKIKGDKDCHEKTHSEQRPFICEICNKSFKTKQVYNQHCKSHTNQKPHVCNICGQGFQRTFVLKMHYLRHSGEKPHGCYLCEKQYRQRGDLMKHLKSQHGIHNNTKVKDKAQETTQ